MRISFSCTELHLEMQYFITVLPACPFLSYLASPVGWYGGEYFSQRRVGYPHRLRRGEQNAPPRLKATTKPPEMH